MRKIDFGKITILIGHNNSGKSSILQSLIVLAQSALSGQNSLKSKNNILDLGEYSDIIHAGDISKPLSFSLEFFEKIKLGAINKNQIEPEMAEFFYKVNFKERNFFNSDLIVKSEHNKLEVHSPTSNKFVGTITRPYENVNWNIRNNSTGIIPSFQLSDVSDNVNQAFNRDFQGDLLSKMFSHFFYIPYQRTIGKFGVKLTTKTPIAQIVTNDPEETNSRLLSTLAKDKNIWPKVSQLFSSVYNENVLPQNLDPEFDTVHKDDRISLQFMKGNHVSSLANEGGGINQLVLLFTILACSPKNSIICLEEPEIHLHPAKQSVLMKDILQIIENDEKQLVLTTHSEHILYPLLAAVSQGKLSKNDLKIYYVQYDNEKLESIVEELDVNEHGQIKGGLKGFWDATSSAMSDFVRKKDEK